MIRFLKKVLFYVSIALILSFIRSNFVSAETINPTGSNTFYEWYSSSNNYSSLVSTGMMSPYNQQVGMANPTYINRPYSINLYLTGSFSNNATYTLTATLRLSIEANALNTNYWIAQILDGYSSKACSINQNGEYYTFTCSIMPTSSRNHFTLNFYLPQHNQSLPFGNSTFYQWVSYSLEKITDNSGIIIDQNQTIINQNQTIINQNNETNQNLNDIDDSINNDDVDSNNTTSTISDLNEEVASNSVISDLLLLPVTLFQNIINSINGSCSSFSLGNLYGTNLTLPCIDLRSLLGTTIYNSIDILISGIFVLAVRKKFVDIFENLSSLKDRGNTLE